uniref:Uncharacterized protein n=1 Tax=Panagrolaimus sp. JU765 TaxID=591449 RepID=A0AC34R8Q7_9BILA
MPKARTKCMNCAGPHVQKECVWPRCIFCWHFLPPYVHHVCGRQWVTKCGVFETIGEYQRALRELVETYGFDSPEVEDAVFDLWNEFVRRH